MAAGGLTRARSARRLEGLARIFVLGVALGVPLAFGLARWVGRGGPAVEIHARVAENGGWMPGDFSGTAGQPLRLRLVSDDMRHSFAIGQSDAPPLDLMPGQVVETTLTFDRPGKYTFYCTRWCGLGHWRMRGTIDVRPAEGAPAPAPATEAAPLYVTLGLDLDAPHPAAAVPVTRPSAVRGAALRLALPGRYLEQAEYRATSPAETWQRLRDEPATQGLSDSQVWDLVAFTRRAASGVAPAERAAARALYTTNCAACHGEGGAGDGVMASALAANEHSAEMAFGEHTTSPAVFTDPATMLGASPAILQGKIIRGGMGTGMPYWGPIFSEAQTWALVEFLWTFQFDE